MAPKGVGIKKVLGATQPEGPLFTQIDCEQAGEAEFGCDDSVASVFEINPGTVFDPKRSSKGYVFDLSITDPTALLGTGTFNMLSFVTIIEYDFKYTKKTKVKVNEVT